MRAKSNPVTAPRANSAATQSTPRMTSSQFTQLPTESSLREQLLLRKITSETTGFNDWCVNSRLTTAFFRLANFSTGRLGMRVTRGHFAALLGRPTFLIGLAAARDAQRIGRNVF